MRPINISVVECVLQTLLTMSGGFSRACGADQRAKRRGPALERMRGLQPPALLPRMLNLAPLQLRVRDLPGKNGRKATSHAGGLCACCIWRRCSCGSAACGRHEPNRRVR